jgi:hypothetical protein
VAKGCTPVPEKRAWHPEWLVLRVVKGQSLKTIATDAGVTVSTVSKANEQLAALIDIQLPRDPRGGDRRGAKRGISKGPVRRKTRA